MNFVKSFILVFFLFTGSLLAQTTGSISGAVKDVSGGVIPGVDVTLTNEGTNATRTAVTEEGVAELKKSLPDTDIQLRYIAGE